MSAKFQSILYRTLYVLSNGGKTKRQERVKKLTWKGSPANGSSANETDLNGSDLKGSSELNGSKFKHNENENWYKLIKKNPV